MMSEVFEFRILEALYNLISNNEKQEARDKKPEASYQRRETGDQSRI